jgi:hypothetical protein
MNFFKQLLNRRNRPEPKPPLLIWGIVSGPYHREEVEDGDDELEWMLLMKVSIGDEVKHSQVWFESYEHVYQMQKYFNKNLEPIEVPQ